MLNPESNYPARDRAGMSSSIPGFGNIRQSRVGSRSPWCERLSRETAYAKNSPIFLQFDAAGRELEGRITTPRAESIRPE